MITRTTESYLSAALTGEHTPDGRQGGTSSVHARFGLLAEPFGVLLPPVRRYRRALGLSVGEVYVAEQLLFHHRVPTEWSSISQEGLAAELGVRRQRVNQLLMGLRQRGLIAVRPDHQFGGSGPDGTPPYFYSADPLLAAVLLWAAHDEVDRTRAGAMRAEARRRLDRQEGASGRGWTWECEGLSTAQGAGAAEVRRRFEQVYDPAIERKGEGVQQEVAQVEALSKKDSSSSYLLRTSTSATPSFTPLRADAPKVARARADSLASARDGLTKGRGLVTGGRGPVASDSSHPGRRAVPTYHALTRLRGGEQHESN